MPEWMAGLKLLPLIWLWGVNVLDFALMGIDKRRARRGAYRVPERRFFLVALLGGTPGAILGMHLFHHKTRHWYFRWGLPALLLVQLLVPAAIWYWLS